MDWITRFSLKNSAVIVIAALLVTLGGLYSAQQLKRETMPDVAIPIVAIVAPYPGAAPADVAQDVTEPLEKAITGVAGLETVNGSSSDSVSVVVASFSYSADMEQAEADVAEAIADVELPETALDATTSRVSMGSQPILRFAVSGGDSAPELQAAVRDGLVPAIEAVDGVGEVNVSNDSDDKIRIVFDADALEEEGLTVDSVVQQLQAANLSFPVGSVQVDEVEQPIRVSGTLASVDDIRDLEIVVYPDSNEMFASAFEQVGDGMGQLGGAVGQLGGAVGQLGQGVGQLGGAVGQMGQGMGQLGGAVGELGGAVGGLAQGTADMGQALGTQMGMATALQEVQAQQLDAKIQLSSAQSVMRDLESQGATQTPEYMQAQMAAAQLEQVIPALDQAAESIKAQMEEAREAAGTPPANGGTPPQPPASSPSMPQASSSGGAPTMSGMSGMAPSSASEGSAQMSMEDPTLELVKLGDVAKVTYGVEDDITYSRANGEPAVLVDVVKTQDANTVEVSNAVQQTIDEYLPRMQTGADVANDSAENLPQPPEQPSVTYTYDGAVMINDSITDMVREGILGAILAFIVILIGLRNVRSTLIAAISIPLSIVIALLFMKQAGVTMNVMTLGGLTVAIGRVVDDSIVVIENIYNHLQAGAPRTAETVRLATREVSPAITSSTIATVAVFAPMALVSGIVGKIFVPFALTVALALLASLLVSVTIVPLLGKWWLLGSKVHPRDESNTRMSRSYRKTLEWSLDRPGVVIPAATLLFVGSLALIPVIGVGFMPPATEKFISVDVEYPAGIAATEVDAAISVVEEDLADEEDFEFYTATVESNNGGFSMASGGVTGGTTGHLFIRLDPEADVDAALERVTVSAEPLVEDGAKVTASQVSMAGGSDSAVEVIVTGPDMESIETAAGQITVALSDVPDLENVTNNLSEKRPQIVTEVDQAAAASYGLNAAMVAGTIRGFVAEQSAGNTSIGGRDAEIVYVNALDEVTSAEDIANRTLPTPMGDEVRIGDVADVEEIATPVSVLTRNGQEYASVSGSIATRDTGAVVSAVNAEIDALELPPDVEIEVAGIASMMSESFEQLALAMLVAIAAVYLVMMLTFGEAIAPLAIMFSLPLAIIGGIVGLWIAGIPLDMPAMIGALMLIGIVTTNAIMLLERVNQKLAEGLSRREALLDAGANRIRPILMTAATTIMALVPMATGILEGALMSQSLAIVVVGGLTTSTLLTLIVVPVVYDQLEALKERVLSRSKRPEDLADAA